MFKRKFVFAFVILFIPVLLFAQDGEHMRKGMGFWNMLLSVKYITAFILVAAGIILLWTNKLSKNTRIIQLIMIFIVFGLLPVFVQELFFSPSPICAVTKPVIFGIKPPYIASFVTIIILSIIAVKGFCAMACPIGALQELLYRIPVLKKLKKIKIPFKISNSIRAAITALFLILFYTLGISVYSYINLFDLIHWEFSLPPVDLALFVLFLIIALGSSLFLFRPFCYFICPMGLATWFVERFSFIKLKLDKSKCNDCTRCEILAPCPSITDLLNEKNFRADCHLCGICINECKHDAIKIGIISK